MQRGRGHFAAARAAALDGKASAVPCLPGAPRIGPIPAAANCVRPFIAMSD